MTETVLIIGGTREAARLASKLVEAHPESRVITSLAGRTKEPEPVAGEVRIGGFGGAQGLADYIAQNRITRLVDASHPFAIQISANVAEASRRTGVPLEIHTRPPWPRQTDDNWIEVADLDQARLAIPFGATVLLALGSQLIHGFAARADVRFVVRMVDTPDDPLSLPNHVLLLGKPSPDWQSEAALMERHAITHIVCRNSGGDGAYAKIEAARQLGLPVIMVQQPKSIADFKPLAR